MFNAVDKDTLARPYGVVKKGGIIMSLVAPMLRRNFAGSILKLPRRINEDCAETASDFLGQINCRCRQGCTNDFRHKILRC